MLEIFGPSRFSLDTSPEESRKSILAWPIGISRRPSLEFSLHRWYNERGRVNAGQGPSFPARTGWLGRSLQASPCRSWIKARSRSVIFGYDELSIIRLVRQRLPGQGPQGEPRGFSSPHCRGGAAARPLQGLGGHNPLTWRSTMSLSAGLSGGMKAKKKSNNESPGPNVLGGIEFSSLH